MRKWIVVLAIIFLAAAGSYLYLFREHRDIKNEKPELIITSALIISEFIQEPSKSEQKYLNKTIQVSGIIKEINPRGLLLSDGIYYTLNDSLAHSSLNIETQITIKGRVIGFDDLLEQIKLDQCFILN